jgi:hypothetical protein
MFSPSRFRLACLRVKKKMTNPMIAANQNRFLVTPGVNCSLPVTLLLGAHRASSFVLHMMDEWINTRIKLEWEAHTAETEQGSRIKRAGPVNGHGATFMILVCMGIEDMKRTEVKTSRALGFGRWSALRKGS